METISIFRNFITKPREILLMAVVSFWENDDQNCDPIFIGKVIPKLKDIVEYNQCESLNFHPLMTRRKKFLQDNVHSNAEVHIRIAQTIF
jgi:hypothetical protein